MLNDRRQSLLLFGLLVVQLLLFLLGEVFVNYFLFGLGGLLLLGFSGWLDWQRWKKYSGLAIAWLLLWSGLLISATSTVSFPLTLHELVRYSWLSSWFWFLLLLDRKKFSYKEFLFGVLLTGLIMVAISFVFYLLPDQSRLLPGMNLLYPTYGHNHLVALLLLIMPLSWWLVWKFASNQIYLLVPVVFSLAILFSFGRVATVLGLIQLVAVFYWFKRISKTKLDFWSGYLRKTLVLLLVVFGSAVLLKSALSLWFIWHPGADCPAPILVKQLCKPIAAEARPHYWQQASLVWQDNFWTGSGPGTYSIAVKKFQATPHNFSIYAHNIFLQNLANLGLIGGGLFMAWFLLFFYQARKIVKKIWETAFLKKTSPWQLAVWLGLLTSLFNFMIDFDWEFIGIASVTLLLLALLIGEESDSFNISEKLAKVFQPVFRLFYRFWLILLILVAGVYLTTEALIFAKQPSRAFQLFPYFYWQRSFYEAKADLSESEKQRLLSVYQNHPEIYLVYLIQTKDHEEIVRLKDRLYELDPWSWSLQDNIDIYLKSSQWEAAEQQLVRKYDFWQLAEERDGHEVSHANKAQLAEDALLLADGFYREGNPTKAAKYYQLAQTLDPWSLDSHQPVFTNLPLNYENQLIFFGKLARVEGEYLGQYRELYFDTYFASLSQAVAQGQLGDLETHAANLLSWSPWGGNQVWEQLGQALLNQASNYQRIGEYQAAQDRLQKAVALQKIVVEHDAPSWFVQERLARQLITVGNNLIFSRPATTLSNYHQAQALMPWALSNSNLWFTNTKPAQLTTDQLQAYFSDLELIVSDDGWQKDAHSQIAADLVGRLIEEKDAQQALNFAREIPNWELLTYQPREQLELQLLSMKQSSEEEGDQETAIILDQLLRQIVPEHY